MGLLLALDCFVFGGLMLGGFVRGGFMLGRFGFRGGGDRRWFGLRQRDLRLRGANSSSRDQEGRHE
jgi:hypothetical protein